MYSHNTCASHPSKSCPWMKLSVSLRLEKVRAILARGVNSSCHTKELTCIAKISAHARTIPEASKFLSGQIDLLRILLKSSVANKADLTIATKSINRWYFTGLYSLAGKSELWCANFYLPREPWSFRNHAERDTFNRTKHRLPPQFHQTCRRRSSAFPRSTSIRMA